MFIWTIGDALGVLGFLLLAAFFLYLFIPLWWKQARCKHDGSIGETSACDAICHKCGKNLGFIGSWRNK